MSNSFDTQSGHSRRDFMEKTLKLAVVGGLGGLAIFSGCKDKEEGDGQKVSPPEDLMQEHGLLNRILLIYDACKMHLVNKESFPRETLVGAAGIMRAFVEDYHEKQEEDYLFPRFMKAGQLTELVQVLLQQHNAGRALTSQVLQLGSVANASDAENQKLIKVLGDFNYMYRPHEAREDTILFPAFRKLVSTHEYNSLGEEFEKNEQKHFGKDGFETMVAKVAAIEQTLDIYDLSKFTPVVTT
ncbi:MAG: hemerythrin domain-containing protein [Flavipsychrobacter sp.]|nr:hemerythrin domain-containing protein [Flavipsychrobacter sp.]